MLIRSARRAASRRRAAPAKSRRRRPARCRSPRHSGAGKPAPDGHGAHRRAVRRDQSRRRLRARDAISRGADLHGQNVLGSDAAGAVGRSGAQRHFIPVCCRCAARTTTGPAQAAPRRQRRVRRRPNRSQAKRPSHHSRATSRKGCAGPARRAVRPPVQRRRRGAEPECRLPGVRYELPLMAGNSSADAPAIGASNIHSLMGERSTGPPRNQQQQEIRRDAQATALSMIKLHGLRAQAVALERAAELRHQGDVAGHDRWQQVHAAICELRRTAPTIETARA